MINLNTCREAIAEARWPRSCLLVLVSLALLAADSRAREPNKALSQYRRDHWGSENGFLGGPINALAQTADGYLWIGSEKGLLRFDGLNFLPVQRFGDTGRAVGPILGLTADADGDLWIRLQGAGLLRYHQGKFIDLTSTLEKHELAITAMCRSRTGTALFASILNGLMKYEGGRLTRVASMPPMPNFLAISMAETSNGTVWLGTRDTGLFELSGDLVQPGPVQFADRKINCLLPGEGPELLLGTDNGVERWAGAGVSDNLSPASSLKGLQILAMTKDQDSNVWVGASQGLFRLPAGLTQTAERDSRFTQAVNTILEDREGNIWAGGVQGLDRLRDTPFTTYTPAEGLPSDNNGPIYIDDDARLWFAPPSGGLYCLAKGQIRRATTQGLANDVVYSITGGKRGLWLGRQRGGLTHFSLSDDGMAAQTYTHAQGLAQNSVYAVHQNADGTIWAGTLSGGVSRLRDGRILTYTTSDGLLSNTITAIEEGSAGAMWFATPKGLSALSNARWLSYTIEDGLPSNDLNCLFEDSLGLLWVGTASGLAAVRAGSVWVPQQMPESLREPIYGIQEDRDGYFWLATSNHVLRVSRTNLLKGAIEDADLREFALPDGLRGIEGVKRNQSVVADPAGHIWFSMNGGISMVDPARLTRNSLPALVQIESLSSDNKPVGPDNRIPASPRKITFRFAALSLSVPERVRFRYRLDGFDQNWSEPATTREAIYTNLGWGSYQFRVIASNSDGLWNSAETVFPIEIERAYWQTWWFRIFAILAAATAIALFFRLRVLRLSHQMNARFEERLAERTRIAQELHDTLLQGFLSASMQLHVANEHLPGDSPAKPFVARVLELMNRVIEEARNAVRGLRVPDSASGNLEKALSAIQQELATAQETDFHVFASGEERPLKPIIREEVYWIGREALVNAFRHSHASSVEVELEYAPSHLRLLVRDNGAGIDPQVVRAGRDGHWGLSGMRERAERIGGRFRVMSAASAGTEVELSVPGHIAFRYPSSPGRLAWLSRLKLRLAPPQHNDREGKSHR